MRGEKENMGLSKRTYVGVTFIAALSTASLAGAEVASSLLSPPVDRSGLGPNPEAVAELRPQPPEVTPGKRAEMTAVVGKSPIARTASGGQVLSTQKVVPWYLTEEDAEPIGYAVLATWDREVVVPGNVLREVVPRGGGRYEERLLPSPAEPMRDMWFFVDDKKKDVVRVLPNASGKK